MPIPYAFVQGAMMLVPKFPPRINVVKGRAINLIFSPFIRNTHTLAQMKLHFPFLHSHM